MDTNLTELTWEEWIKIGEAMKKAYNLLLGKLMDAKPKSGAEARRYRKAVKSIDHVRDTLDSLVIEAFPDKSNATHVFYGPRHPSEVEA